MSSSLSLVARADRWDLDDVSLGALLPIFRLFGMVPVRRAFSDADSLGATGAAAAVSVPRLPMPPVTGLASVDGAVVGGRAAPAFSTGAAASGLVPIVAPAVPVKEFTVAAAALSIVC